MSQANRATLKDSKGFNCRDNCKKSLQRQPADTFYKDSLQRQSAEISMEYRVPKDFKSPNPKKLIVLYSIRVIK